MMDEPVLFQQPTSRPKSGPKPTWKVQANAEQEDTEEKAVAKVMRSTAYAWREQQLHAD